MLKMKRILKRDDYLEGERVKWYHGFAYYDGFSNKHFFYLIPFNFIVRLIWEKWPKIQFPKSQNNDRIRQAYGNGYRDGIINFEKGIVDRIKRNESITTHNFSEGFRAGYNMGFSEGYKNGLKDNDLVKDLGEKRIGLLPKW